MRRKEKNVRVAAVNKKLASCRRQACGRAQRKRNPPFGERKLRARSAAWLRPPLALVHIIAHVFANTVDVRLTKRLQWIPRVLFV